MSRIFPVYDDYEEERDLAKELEEAGIPVEVKKPKIKNVHWVKRPRRGLDGNCIKVGKTQIVFSPDAAKKIKHLYIKFGVADLEGETKERVLVVVPAAEREPDHYKITKNPS